MVLQTDEADLTRLVMSCIRRFLGRLPFQFAVNREPGGRRLSRVRVDHRLVRASNPSGFVFILPHVPRADERAAPVLFPVHGRTGAGCVVWVDRVVDYLELSWLGASEHVAFLIFHNASCGRWQLPVVWPRLDRTAFFCIQRRFSGFFQVFLLTSCCYSERRLPSAPLSSLHAAFPSRNLRATQVLRLRLYRSSQPPPVLHRQGLPQPGLFPSEIPRPFG